MNYFCIKTKSEKIKVGTIIKKEEIIYECDMMQNEYMCIYDKCLCLGKYQGFCIDSMIITKTLEKMVIEIK